MNLTLLLPAAGLLIGMVAALAGVGGGFVVVPFLLWLGFSKEAAVSTSFLNMIFLVATSLLLYGMKGDVDWRAGLLLGAGSVVGAFLAANFIQPHLDEKTFRYFFAGLLIVTAAFVLIKK